MLHHLPLKTTQNILLAGYTGIAGYTEIAGYTGIAGYTEIEKTGTRRLAYNHLFFLKQQHWWVHINELYVILNEYMDPLNSIIDSNSKVSLGDLQWFFCKIK